MGKIEEYKPEMAMTMIQLCYAGVNLFARATLVNGLSPRVFILYRQAFATIFIFPFLYFSRRKSKIAIASLDLKSFSLIFVVSLIGVTVNQNLYLEGLYLTSSSMGSAVGNIIPAITFLISFLAGYEKLNLRDIRGLAKIAGTILCVAGAVSMTLLRGPKILNSESALPLAKSVLGNVLKDQNMWLVGCLFLFSSTLCWSFWLILQVPISTYYPDNLSLSAWMCLFGTMQCAVVTFFLEDSNAWILHSYSEFATCLYAGIGASALSFTVQAWAISKRGPVFSALFNPLCTVIVTILAALFFQEEIYTGSLIGGLGVIMGLYTVLWGKAKDVMMNQERIRDYDQNSEVKIHIEDSSKTAICNGDLKNPLLSKHKSTEEIQTHEQLK
ncbi:PREDICTED: WAT1-related protein At4g30420 [Camelina sativa]|uniref:WAT1-related protein n=1 Tax=Camelina sativa TaxID=90675 RepID=A0ABM0UA66_CAMSA|nr:PREDICTED: WAT1-related protein At4g30420 [Camelina sativa]